MLLQAAQEPQSRHCCAGMVHGTKRSSPTTTTTTSYPARRHAEHQVRRLVGQQLLARIHMPRRTEVRQQRPVGVWRCPRHGTRCFVRSLARPPRRLAPVKSTTVSVEPPPCQCLLLPAATTFKHAISGSQCINSGVLGTCGPACRQKRPASRGRARSRRRPSSGGPGRPCRGPGRRQSRCRPASSGWG